VTINIPELVGKLLDAVLFLGHNSNEVDDEALRCCCFVFEKRSSQDCVHVQYMSQTTSLERISLRYYRILNKLPHHHTSKKNWRGPQQNRWKQRKQTAGGRNKGRGKHSKPSNLH
jgi:hypothetical protein